MAGTLEDTIRKQGALVKALEEQHAADRKLLDAQKQTVQIPEEKVSLLEKENRELASAGNELSASCGRLEKLCTEQQKLLDSLTGIFSEL